MCRSPYLEATLARKLPLSHVFSAGFVGPGRSVPDHSLASATERGIDLSTHRSQLITPTLARSADLVIVMDSAQARLMVRRFGVNPAHVIQAGDIDPEFADGRTITDPWGQPRVAFDTCFDRLDRCADELVRLISIDV